jgi:hypothetical protein
MSLDAESEQRWQLAEGADLDGVNDLGGPSTISVDPDGTESRRQRRLDVLCEGVAHERDLLGCALRVTNDGVEGPRVWLAKAALVSEHGKAKVPAQPDAVGGGPPRFSLTVVVAPGRRI